MKRQILRKVCVGAVFCFALGLIVSSGTRAATDPAPAAATTGPSDARDDIAPKWGASDPDKWPIVYLYNDGVLTGNMGIGGSGFLFTLPNHAVVAATVLHVFGDGFKIEDVDKSVKSWSMVSPVSPQKKVAVKKLAMTIDPTEPVDCVIVNVSPMRSWPAEVLTPRSAPAHVGEVVYIPGIPPGGEHKPGFHKATVISINPQDSTFNYVFDPEIETQGFSGAPVLDSKGLLVGIHQGHGTTGSGKKFWVGMQITAAVKVANAPASAVAATPAGKPTPAGAAPAPAVDNSAVAERALDMAQNYISSGKYDTARTKLQDIVTTYPTTPAAKKAKALLAQIQDK